MGTVSTKKKGLALVGFISAAAMVAALVSPALFAQAQLAGSSAFIVTNAPDLRTSSFASGGRVRLCYDENVSNPGPAGTYFVAGYDSDSTIFATDGPTAPSVDSSDPKCVFADFSGVS